MFISPINAYCNSRFISKNKVNNEPIQPKEPTQNVEQPSFKRSAYNATFTRYFSGSSKYASNSEKFRALMSAAIKSSGAAVDEITQVFMKPHDYSGIMDGFRNKRPVYKDLNNSCFERPLLMVGNNGEPLVSIVNFGFKGGFFDLFTGNLKEDTRICFHGLNENKNCVICLGKEPNGDDTCETTSDGIGILLASIMTRNL